LNYIYVLDITQLFGCLKGVHELSFNRPRYCMKDIIIKVNLLLQQFVKVIPNLEKTRFDTYHTSSYDLNYRKSTVSEEYRPYVIAALINIQKALLKFPMTSSFLKVSKIIYADISLCSAMNKLIDAHGVGKVDIYLDNFMYKTFFTKLS